MERPWGLSGPEFLELYWIALAVSVVFAVFVRVRLRGTRGDAPAGALGLLDIAYLTGGPRRVVETSVASLIDSGALVPARNGAVRLVGSPVADHPVDQAVIADAKRYRYRTLSLLITSVSEKDAPREVGRRLSEQDYLVAPDVAKRRLRTGVVPMALVFVVGAARWITEQVVGGPVWILTLQLVLTGLLIWGLLQAAPRTRTAKGRDAVAKARAGEITGGWGGTSSANAAELVALNGFSSHPSITVRAAARPRARTTTGRARGRYSATSGVSTCSGGGGGCSAGSGSSCGGGGGGCGGGGGGG
ncbi:TIGR04222 domain-containing membrane protein [Saccharothrix luteola]|uniref:TIGR04222 domain-containing membrane protein n=1 Tax=Saccharothrix luteola TaxID=2893018 RepID=UPI001E30C2A2|nr:TIGR04222 domain-containing membrane protein [Saccharothrix luteola]MCC8249659.1 TIGR04222 domain-containing membrane protein [Saccharothrix luteola]